MSQNRVFIIRCVIFLLLVSAILFALTWVFLPKAYFNNDWTDTSTVSNFYSMDRDSIDVLFLGSSHSFTSFSPQDLYDEYGVTSYNLGTGQQSLLVSYYWLKEALQYQHPKVVVLDTYLCYYSADHPLNCEESAVRYAIDPMRWSAVKLEAIAAICQHDTSQTLSSYFNPLERFHARWDALKEDDFCVSERLSHGDLKGYSLLSGKSGINDYLPVDPSVSLETEDMIPLMREYLDCIVDTCQDEGIELVLVATPYLNAGIGRYNTSAAYASARNLAYYDFNTPTLYWESAFDFANDTIDIQHPNYWGARKLTHKIGEILTSQPHGVMAQDDAQWEESRDFCQAAAHNAELRYITDVSAYLDAIDRSAYTVFIALKDEGTASLTEDVAARLHGLGLTTDLRDKYGYSYLAVIDDNDVIEYLGEEPVSTYGALRHGQSLYQIGSAGHNFGDQCSIMIDGHEWAKQNRGLNIVVYDNVYREVIDSVAFDTGDTLQAVR